MTRFVIDPGHGGSSPTGNSSAYGARGTTGTLEKDVTLDIARHVVASLGSSASMTRTGDSNLSLGDRAAYARRNGAEVFVSIHANSGSPELDGAETWVHTAGGSGSRALASGIQRSLDRLSSRYGGNGGRCGGACRSGDLAVLSPGAVGATDACLVEVDYLSSPRGEQRLRDPHQRAAMGAAIANAIREHAGLRRYGVPGDPCAPTANDATACPVHFNPSGWSIQDLFNGIDSRDSSTDRDVRNDRGAIIDEIRMNRVFDVNVTVNWLTDTGSAAVPPEDEISVAVDNGCIEAGMAFARTQTARVGETKTFTFAFKDFPQHYQPLKIGIMETDRSGTPGGASTVDPIPPEIVWDPRSGHITGAVGGGAYTVTITTRRL